MSRTIAFRIVFAAAALFCSTEVTTAAFADPRDPAVVVPSRRHSREETGVDAFPTVTAPDPVVSWMAGQVEQDEVERYVAELSGEAPAVVSGSPYTILSRHMDSGMSIENAAAYVGEHMTGLGLDVEYHRWGSTRAPNVIGEKRGVARPGQVYMVTAHLDDMPTGIAPGADDDASGCAAVLVAADILSQFDWDCTLRFAFWTGNEQRLDGSSRYALRASNGLENIAGMINLDMIGRHDVGSTAVDLHADSAIPSSVELAHQIESIIDVYGLGLAPQVLDDAYGESDHASFWRYGYSAVFGTEHFAREPGEIDPYYHTANDRLSTLDLVYVTEFVKAAVAGTAHMAGCLRTGRLEGTVSAAHSGSPIANAEIALRDAAGRRYVLRTGPDGRYSQTLPPAAYSATISAYGCESTTASGIQLPANGSLTEDGVLVALPPTAPITTGMLQAGEVELAWQHVAPNTAYYVRRSTDPYFAAADEDVLVAAVNANHPPEPAERSTYRDSDSGAGDESVNHFYRVQGVNAAGAAAASGLTGEFDFSLVRPTGPP